MVDVKKNKGITLIELLVSISIIMTLSSAIFSAFFAVNRIFKHSNEQAATFIVLHRHISDEIRAGINSIELSEGGELVINGNIYKNEEDKVFMKDSLLGEGSFEAKIDEEILTIRIGEFERMYKWKGLTSF